MANPSVSPIENDLLTEVGPDATSTFETGGNYAGSDPTGNAGSESLYSARGTGSAARNTADDLDDDDEDDVEDEDDDDLEDDEDEEDDLDEEDDDEDDDLEDDEDDDEEDDDEDEDDEDTLKTESSDAIRSRNTITANSAAKHRL